MQKVSGLEIILEIIGFDLIRLVWVFDFVVYKCFVDFDVDGSRQFFKFFENIWENEKGWFQSQKISF